MAPISIGAVSDKAGRWCLDDIRRTEIIWNHLGFENAVFLLGYSGKYGFHRGLKYLFMLLGFKGNGLVTLLVVTSNFSILQLD